MIIMIGVMLFGDENLNISVHNPFIIIRGHSHISLYYLRILIRCTLRSSQFPKTKLENGIVRPGAFTWRDTPKRSGVMV